MPRLTGPRVVTSSIRSAIAVLMVSRLPVFSGKRVGKRVTPEMVLPVFVMVVLFFALLISYPWVVLTIGTVCYLASLPFGYLSYRGHERKDAAGAVASSRPRRRARPSAQRGAAAVAGSWRASCRSRPPRAAQLKA